nr:secretoglobin family 2B member 2 isoform X1 [Pongo abelii]
MGEKKATLIILVLGGRAEPSLGGAGLAVTQENKMCEIPCPCLLGPDSAVMRVTSTACALVLALICSVQLGDACLDIDKLLANVVFDVSRDLLKEELARYNPSPLTEESFLKVQQCFANVSVTERFAHSVVIKKILQSNDCIEAAF